MKIIAVGMNYALHNKELGHTLVNNCLLYTSPSPRDRG